VSDFSNVLNERNKKDNKEKWKLSSLSPHVWLDAKVESGKIENEGLFTPPPPVRFMKIF
jgi:hypothetical protein